jgi:hypothetical protein
LQLLLVAPALERARHPPQNIARCRCPPPRALPPRLAPAETAATLCAGEAVRGSGRCDGSRCVTSSMAAAALGLCDERLPARREVAPRGSGASSVAAAALCLGDERLLGAPLSCTARHFRNPEIFEGTRR